MPLKFSDRITVDYSSLQALLAKQTDAKTAADLTADMEGKTVSLLKDINTTTVTGPAVITAIQKTGKTMQIVAAQHSEDAEAAPASWEDATPKGKKALDPTPGDGRDPTGGVRGTGLGSDVTIFYTPIMWATSASSCTADVPCGPGSARDEVLLHEIFHGLRIMLGLQLCVKMGDHYTTEEEFYAILVTNIYSSELDRELRGNHEEFTKLSKPGGFPGQYRQRIAVLKSQQPDLAAALSKIKPKNGFNPLAGK
jgi:hypothetical protein